MRHWAVIKVIALVILLFAVMIGGFLAYRFSVAGPRERQIQASTAQRYKNKMQAEEAVDFVAISANLIQPWGTPGEAHVLVWREGECQKHVLDFTQEFDYEVHVFECLDIDLEIANENFHYWEDIQLREESH